MAIIFYSVAGVSSVTFHVMGTGSIRGILWTGMGMDTTRVRDPLTDTGSIHGILWTDTSMGTWKLRGYGYGYGYG